MLAGVAKQAADAGLALDQVAAARLSAPVLDRMGRTRERRAMAQAALAAAEGFPDSPALREVAGAGLDPRVVREHAETFGEPVFRERMAAIVDAAAA